jgi:hypothetical protein
MSRRSRFGLLRVIAAFLCGKRSEQRKILLSGKTLNERKAVIAHRSPKPSAVESSRRSRFGLLRVIAAFALRGYIAQRKHFHSGSSPGLTQSGDRSPQSKAFGGRILAAQPLWTAASHRSFRFAGIHCAKEALS